MQMRQQALRIRGQLSSRSCTSLVAPTSADPLVLPLSAGLGAAAATDRRLVDGTWLCARQPESKRRRLQSQECSPQNHECVFNTVGIAIAIYTATPRSSSSSLMPLSPISGMRRTNSSSTMPKIRFRFM